MRKFLMAAAVLAVAACAEKAPETDDATMAPEPTTEMTPGQMVDSAGKMVDSAGTMVDSAGKMMKDDTSHAM